MTHVQVKGYSAAGVSCGLKPDGKKDLALIVGERPCTVAGVFTTNRVKAAPVLYDMLTIGAGKPVRAVVANAGNANACTGEQGMSNVRAMADQTARVVGCTPDEVLVLSTGVIGVQMPMDKVLPGIQAAAQALAAEGWDAAAHAIMTTDTRPKIVSLTSHRGYTITGIAKGAGMIAPNMATMLAVIVTDAQATRRCLHNALMESVNVSFNRIVVDGDMSTNDTVLLLANGASGVAVDGSEVEFGSLLRSVCVTLAQAIVRDGEGATKFVTVEVTGAPDQASALAVARSIATSPLCKTAFYGNDPNWGRIVCAAGYSGAAVEPDRLTLELADANGGAKVRLVVGGQPADYDENAAIALMQGPEWSIHLDLGLGGASSTVWTCDLSPEYVSINGHYRT